MSPSPAEESVAELASRCARIPSLLAEAHESVARELAQSPFAISAEERVVVTGIGGSEGPARYLVALLRDHLALEARFAPLSAFYGSVPAGEVLVVFSQGLCPNTRLAFARASAFKRALVVTSQKASRIYEALRLLDQNRVRVLTIPPEREDGTLIRVMAPAAACAAAATLASHLSEAEGAKIDFSPVPEAYERGLAEAIDAELLEHLFAFVTVGEDGSMYQGLRWKLVEGLLVREPSMWDVLQVSHGAFQQFFEGPMTLVALDPRTPRSEALLGRLERMLSPERHRLVRITSDLPAPLAFFAYDARLNGGVVRALRARPKDLYAWPAKGKDGALYGIEDDT